jgi:hypothetical protein
MCIQVEVIAIMLEMHKQWLKVFSVAELLAITLMEDSLATITKAMQP